MKKKRGCYVYELVDPIDSRVFYVGKGTDRRYSQHYREVKNGKIANDSNWHLTFELLHLIQNGREPEYNFPCGKELEETAAYAWEAAHIQFYGMKNLCNRTPGGIVHKPWLGKHHAQSTKDKIKSSNTTSEGLTKGWVGTIRGKYGSFIKYFDYYYQKQKEKQDKSKVWELKKDLMLLKSVIVNIRKKMAAKEKEMERYRSRGIISIDHKERMYKRLCPTCNIEIIHRSWDGFKQATRERLNCRHCGGIENAKRNKQLGQAQYRKLSLNPA